jgi:hypothetical protein
MTKEIYLVQSERALSCVDRDTMFGEAVKERTQM